MNNVLHIGAMGLRAQQTAVDVVANNVANMNTPAYKRNTVSFSELVAQSAAQGAGAAEAGLGVAVSSSPKVFEQGELRKTDAPLDLAIRGAGFIELLAPGGQTVLWRGGALRVNNDGFLAADNGLPLKANVSVPRDASQLVIAENGQVFAAVAGESRPQQIGQIDLVSVSDARALTTLGQAQYRLEDTLVDTVRGAPGESGLGLLAQGHAETSNVKMIDEMVNMVLMQRAYAANARLVQVADEMMGTINNLRR